MSAPAVFAVRRGFRVTLPRARGPTGRHPATGRDATRRNPRASTGDAVSTPSTTAPAPQPSRAPAWSAVGSRSARATAPMPATTSVTPITARRTSERSGRATSSRSASTGGTSAARRAGTAAATTLTSVPTSTETTRVNPSSGTRPVSCIPNVPSTARRSTTSPRPPATPSTAPTTPTIAACSTIEEEHLQRGGPHGAQQGELAGPLPDPHGERVGDDEAADEQRDPSEHQQERGDEPEDREDVLGRLRAHLVPGHRLRRNLRRRGHGSEPVHQLLLGETVVRQHRDGGDRPVRRERGRRRAGVEEDDGRTGQRRPEPHLTDHRDRPDLAAHHHARPVADREAGRAQRRRLHPDLVGTLRRLAGDDVHGPVPRVVREPEARRLGALHRGAVGSDQDERPLQVREHRGDPVHRLELVDQRQRHRVAHLGADPVPAHRCPRPARHPARRRRRGWSSRRCR